MNIHYSFIFLFLILLSCNSRNPANKSKEKINLTFQIIPEDYEKNWYVVEWKDTLGIKQGYNVIERPKEIWCIITNRSNDTLGYYRGQSTAQTFAYFQPTDSIVTLNFMIGLTLFRSAKSLELKQDLICFEPVEINLNTDLKKEFEMILKEKN
jgi:hypothetical protein